MKITLDSNTARTKRFRIFTDYEVRFRKHVRPYGDVYGEHPQSINEIIRNTGQYSRIYQNSNNSYISERLVMNTINNVYITSPNLGSFDTIAHFSNNVIRKVPVIASYGYMIVDQTVSPADYLSCSSQTLKTLEFHLRDGLGNFMNLVVHYITFSSVFYVHVYIYISRINYLDVLNLGIETRNSCLKVDRIKGNYIYMVR